MNYYRRYVGSYLKKTTKISMIEDGAYTRLLDTYYADEKPLDPAEAYTIARAMTAAERKAVESVVAKYFYLGDDGLLHNEKADEELGIAIPKLEKLRAVAHENGKKGGRPPGSGKKTGTGSHKKPDPVVDKEPKPVMKEEPDPVIQKPDPVCFEKQPSSVSLKPNPQSNNRFPGDGYISDPPPLATAEGAEIPVNPDVMARIIAECQRAKVEGATEGNAVIERWLRQGATPSQVVLALVEARQSVQFPKPLRVGYVDTILVGIMEQDAKARAAAEINVKRAQEVIAESVEARAHAAPPPDDLMAPYRRKAAAS